jgi:hypothetical protein
MKMRPMAQAIGTSHAALMIAFGWVVWESAPHRTLRIVGALLTPAVGPFSQD